MITLVSQPNNEWVSAYEPNVFEFKYYKNLGTYTFNAFVLGTNYKFNTGNSAITAMFKVGDKIRLNGVGVEHTILAIVSNEITISLVSTIPLGPTFNATVQLLDDKPKQCSLLVGRINAGVNWTKLADLYVIFRNGKHSVDLQGYLQDYFRNMQPPPVTGVDNQLYVNYKLTLDNNDIGSIHSSAYSTIEGLGASQFATVGKPLRIGNVEVFNTNKSIYSRINASTIENFVI